ncbi:hypothetical protein JNUCC0626_24610 [Lentzea sp. JNUCC 0626]
MTGSRQTTLRVLHSNSFSGKGTALAELRRLYLPAHLDAMEAPA